MSDSVYFQFTRYSQPLLIVLGTFGSVLNLILFYYRRPLRMSSCSLYFRALSFNDLLVLYAVVFPLWLENQFGVDPTRRYNWYCKMKTYFTDSLYTLSPYFLVLGCFDRLCTSSTNARLRRIATVPIAACLIPCMGLFIFAAYTHVLAGYRLASYSSVLYCYSPDPAYSRFISLFILVFLCILPPVLMIILCTITLVFLRQQRRRVMPANQMRLRQRDGQLLKMLFVYVVLNVTCTVPFAVTYVMLMFQQPRYAPAHVVLFRLFGLLLNVNFATSFYAYTLGTPYYRQELARLLGDIRTRVRQINDLHSIRRMTLASSLT